MTPISFHTVDVHGHKIFYREAGPKDAPPLLMLHGFPSSSHMFRNLIPLLATRFRIIAPDLPGFGFSSALPRAEFEYKFENLAEIIDRFTDTVQLPRYAMYIFDYGAPIGLRLAVRHPERITAIISQNGNAYLEGLSEGWDPIRAYWETPTKENRDALRSFLTPETTQWQYTHGVFQPDQIAPEAYTLDSVLMARAENDEIQLDLLLDYASNVGLYPVFQDYFRRYCPPLLAVWGKNDPFFLPPGADAFRRDLPDAEVRFFETGHFALETHHAEIAAEINKFLDQVMEAQEIAAA